MSFCLQVAGDGDIFPMLAIYAPYVRDTAITFEYEVPTAAEFGARLHHVLPEYPWLVCRAPGQVLGYAYAHRHMERAAYGWNVECSVYVLGSARGRGVGRALYGALLELLRLQGWSMPMAASPCPTRPARPCTGRRGFPCWGISPPRAGSRAAGTTSSGTVAACRMMERESLRRCVLSAALGRIWWTRCCGVTPADDVPGACRERGGHPRSSSLGPERARGGSAAGQMAMPGADCASSRRNGPPTACIR